ncbi:MAG: TlpA disulfide reductase family protein [Candidatus Cloacimonetes bacterium]|nr:TlpA disulfide reductase family protein [Candidatus Cloacimonadota bacterium]
MFRNILLIALLGLLSVTLWAANFDEFLNLAIENQEEPDSLKALVQEYLYRAQNVEEHRTLQNVWVSFDLDACLNHYARLAKANPNNPDYAYLAIRMLPDSAEQKAEAHKIINKFPQYYWGYRIVSVSLTGNFLQEQREEYIKSDDFMKDSNAVDLGLETFPDDEFLNLAKIMVLYVQKKYAEAALIIPKLKDPQIFGNHHDFICDVTIKAGRQDLYPRIIDLIHNDYVQKGMIAPEYLDYLRKRAMMSYSIASYGIKGLDDYVAQIPELTEDENMIKEIIALYLKHEKIDKAFEYFGQAINKNLINYPEVAHSSVYDEFRGMPEFTKLEADSQQRWDSNKQSRNQELLANRINTPAPPWSLPDIAGNIHTMQDMNGDVIILDFWAQWCGPCKMVMPNLSSWVINEKPDGVEVFSINVMENDYDKAKEYFTENHYAMAYLEGTQDVAQAYGVEGIPHIVVIDKQGNIAWQQSGFSYDLEDKLSFWAEYLTKE